MEDLYQSVALQQQQISPLPFLREVANLYHRNAWLFIRMLLPAVCFGYLILFLSFRQASEIERHLPRGVAILSHTSELWEIGFYRFGGLILDWLMYCFSFAGISVAVSELSERSRVGAEDSYGPVRSRLGSFFGLSLLLWVLVALSSLCAIVVSTLLPVKGSLFQTNGYWKSTLLFAAVWSLFLWLASRFGLAMPILLLRNAGVLDALRRSYRLTIGCWTILALLLLESLGGSYIAYFIPQWLWAAAYAHGVRSSWMPWVCTIVGLLAGMLLLPHMLIGFPLLYIRRSRAPVAIDANNVTVTP